MNYLYNGVELPALPEWDKTVYPNLIIYYDNGANQYRIVATDVPMVYGYESSIGKYSVHGHYNSGKKSWMRAEYNDGEWTEFVTITNSSATTLVYCDGDAVWTNHDILNENDDTIYLAASDPIPVTTAPSVDPLSLLMGWRMGNAVRNMQSK